MHPNEKVRFLLSEVIYATIGYTSKQQHTRKSVQPSLKLVYCAVKKKKKGINSSKSWKNLDIFLLEIQIKKTREKKPASL